MESIVMSNNHGWKDVYTFIPSRITWRKAMLYSYVLHVAMLYRKEEKTSSPLIFS